MFSGYKIHKISDYVMEIVEAALICRLSLLEFLNSAAQDGKRKGGYFPISIHQAIRCVTFKCQIVLLK